LRNGETADRVWFILYQTEENMDSSLLPELGFSNTPGRGTAATSAFGDQEETPFENAVDDSEGSMDVDGAPLGSLNPNAAPFVPGKSSLNPNAAPFVPGGGYRFT